MSGTLHAPAETHEPRQPHAASVDEARRVRLGINAATPADVLVGLASDPSVQVRAALALNPAAPSVTFGLLARDADSRVRALLAQRLGGLAPTLDAAAQTQLQQHAVAALAHLIEDEAIRVRAAIAEAVKEMPRAPRELVLRLARDSAIEVSEPVIRLSPLLTQADLLNLLAGTETPAVALAVARRPHLTMAVSDAIALTSDSEAIRALLSNHSAQIREATLDRLIAEAADHVTWHEPLVHRPDLSPGAARALSRIVADTLLAELAQRGDLGPEIAQELRERLTNRLAQAPEISSTTTSSADPSLSDALSQARTLAAAGKLTEAGMLEVTGRGEARLASTMLAVAADVPYAVVDHAIQLRSAKGLTSLAWKAGFGMRTATALQGLLARLGPNGLLAAGPGGTYPLTIEEMRWQIEFLTRERTRA
jgi:uncharacterized protein (DUF2336 family)